LNIPKIKEDILGYNSIRAIAFDVSTGKISNYVGEIVLDLNPLRLSIISVRGPVILISEDHTESILPVEYRNLPSYKPYDLNVYPIETVPSSDLQKAIESLLASYDLKLKDELGAERKLRGDYRSRGLFLNALTLDLLRKIIPEFIDKKDIGSSSPLILQPKKPGGIDFRFLPIVTQAIGNLSADINAKDLSRIAQLDLNAEWNEIEKLINAQIIPSSERLKEYLQAACLQKRLGQEDRDKIILSIANTLRCEEERSAKTDPGLIDILVALEANKSGEELRQIFLGTPA